MRSWLPIAILLTGCGHSSDFAIGQAAAALVEVAAAGVAAAAGSGGAWPAPNFRVLPPPPAKPPSLLQTVECAPGRSYSLFRPDGSGAWGCYFENSDGHRYPCRQSGNPAYAPSELDEWCHPVRPTPPGADPAPPFGPD